MKISNDVVLIDDKIEEALPLIKLFSKLNISCKYFDGKFENLSNNKLNNLSIIFSDIYLNDLGSSEENQISHLVSFLEELFQKNTPYILILWTKHKDLDEKIQAGLDDLGLFPITIICLNKFDYFKINGSSFSLIYDEKETILKLTSEIELKLMELELPLMSILHNWKVSFLDGIEDILNNTNKLIDIKNWNNDMYNLLISMTKASVGKNIGNLKPEQQIIEGLNVFNMLLMDEIEHKEIELNISLPNINEPVINTKLKSKINNSLLLKMDKNNFNKPGSVYKVANDYKLKRQYLECESEAKTKIYNHFINELTNDITKTIEYFKNILKTDIENYLLSQDEENFLIDEELLRNICSILIKVEGTVNKELEYYDFLIPYLKKTKEIKVDAQFVLKIKRNYESISTTGFQEKIKEISKKIYQEFFKFEQPKRDYLEKKFIKRIIGAMKRSISIVSIEISPTCDYANNKKVYHRYIYGLKIKLLSEELSKSLKKIYKYSTPILSHNDEIFEIFFEPRFFFTKNINSIPPESTYLFTLRKQLLLDIQAQVVHHITRPGIINL